jgi:hypothetical protein
MLAARAVSCLNLRTVMYLYDATLVVLVMAIFNALHHDIQAL